MKKLFLSALALTLITSSAYADLEVTRKPKSKIGSSELIVVDVKGGGGSGGSVDTNTVIDIVKTMISGTNSPLGGVSANLGTPMVISNFNAKTGTWIIEEIADFGVRIGENTRGTGNSGTHNQEVVIGRDARSSGAAAVSVGPNSESDGAQAVAIGWRAMAIGAHSVAIGSGLASGHNYWTDDTHTNKNPLANGTLAEGEQSIAIGHGAHAIASRSIQFGKGTNSVPNSVKINDTIIFKDGKLVGVENVNTNDIKGIITENNRPKIITDTEPGEVLVQSYCMNTLNLSGDIEEICIKFSDTRNYELFIPNTESFRKGLPIGFDTNIEGEVLKLGAWWGKKITVLPARVSVKEPYDKNIMIDVEEYETNWNWTPVVTKAVASGGSVNVEGTNLHFTASVKIDHQSYDVEEPLYNEFSITASDVRGKTGKIVDKDGKELTEFIIE